LLIAAVARASSLPLYPRNSKDFTGLDDLVEFVPIRATSTLPAGL
jgi:predicted nucleic acid-binding protein